MLNTHLMPSPCWRQERMLLYVIGSVAIWHAAVTQDHIALEVAYEGACRHISTATEAHEKQGAQVYEIELTVRRINGEN